MKIKNKIQARYKELTPTAKAALWFTLCNFILKGVNFISTPLFAALLSTSEYGILSVFLAYEQIILILSTWEISLSSYQKGLIKYKDSIPLFTKSALLFSNIITTIFFVLAFMTHNWIQGVTGFAWQNLLCIYIYLLLQPAFNCWIILKRNQFDYRAAVTFTIINALISVIVPMIAVLIISRTANVKFNFTLIGSSLVFIWFYFNTYKNGGSLSDKKEVIQQWKFIASFQIPLVIHSLSYTVLAQADRVMISKMVGTSQAAYYSVAYNIAQVIGIVQSSLMQALIPWILNNLDSKDYKNIHKNSGPLLLLVAAAVALFVFVSPEVIKFLFSKDYYEAIWSLPPVSISAYFMFLNSLFVWVENYYEKTNYVAIASVTCAVTNVILNYFAIGIFGYIACGYTTLISYVLFALLHYCFVFKIQKENNVKEKIYDLRLNMIISFALVVVMIAAVITYERVFVRYLIVSFILVIMIAFRKKFMKELAKVRKL